MPTMENVNEAIIIDIEKLIDKELEISKENNNLTKNSKSIDKKKYMKDYRIKNKEKWYEKRKCVDCGGSYTVCNHTNHLRSKKHEYAIIAKENIKLQEIINNI